MGNMRLILADAAISVCADRRKRNLCLQYSSDTPTSTWYRILPACICFPARTWTNALLVVAERLVARIVDGVFSRLATTPKDGNDELNANCISGKKKLPCIWVSAFSLCGVGGANGRTTELMSTCEHE